MHTPITHPDQLATLSAEQLLASVRPILRKGGLTASKDRFERIRPNISSAIWELADRWNKSPVLDSRNVGFEEYLAAKLCNHLHTLDRRQNPAIYRGGFDPYRETAALELVLRHGGKASYPSLNTNHWAESMPLALTAAQIAQPSHNELINRLQRMDAGERITEHTWRRLDGAPPELARRTPATQQIRFARDLLDL